MIEPARPRIRIKSGGYYFNTSVHVVNDDGSETLLPNVLKVTWECKADHIATVTLELDDVDVDIVGEDHGNPVDAASDAANTEAGAQYVRRTDVRVRYPQGQGVLAAGGGFEDHRGGQEAGRRRRRVDAPRRRARSPMSHDSGPDPDL